MADLETTQAQLRSTPTAGVSGEHSPYYRRLFSAGYKGYVQGMIAGGTLYTAIGMAIGAVVGVPLAIATGGLLPLILVPAIGSISGVYGAHTFSDIGKTAAIYADGAEVNEKRRYLFDRYQETQSEEEAKEIKRQLEEDYKARIPEKGFHWRPAIIGAALGITVMLVSIAIAPYFAPEIFHSVLSFLGIAGSHSGAALAISGTLATAAAAAIGGLAGSVIGIDREYIRRWMDKAEVVVHDPGMLENQVAERERNIQRLSEAAARDDNRRNPFLATTLRTHEDSQKVNLDSSSDPLIASYEALQAAREAPISPRVIAGLQNAPANTVRNTKNLDRVVNPQLATTEVALN